MRIICSEAEFTGKGSVVALGMFDGVHIGHQRLIRTAAALARQMDAESIVCTFDRHPLSVLFPEKAPEPLLSPEENLKKFEILGADIALVKPFTKDFAAMLPEDYVRLLTEKLRAKVIVIGENYTFGREGRGNAEMVKNLAGKYGYLAEVVKPVEDGEGMISSTRIRALLKAGKKEYARKLLEIEGNPQGI